MALPLGKLGLIVGAGLVGSVLVKEGQVSNVSDLVSGAFKILYNQLSKGGPAVKPRNDALMEQVNSIRQELQSLGTNKALLIVTGSDSGSSKYGMIVIVVVGCGGYAWWKGWKLPGMMFATKRGLSEACNVVAKQLDDLYSSLRLSRRELSSKIDSVGSQVKEVTVLTVDTNRKVNEISQEIGAASKDIMFVQQTVFSLRTKLERMEGKQDVTNKGVMQLVGVANDMKRSRAASQIRALPPGPSGKALQRRQIVSGLQHARSLPPSGSSTSAPESDEILPVQVTPTSTRQQDLSMNPEAIIGARVDAAAFNEYPIQQVSANEPSSSSRFGKILSGFGSLMRTQSAIATRPLDAKQAGLGGALN